MSFWKIEKLQEDIKSNEFSEKDRFIYALIFLTLATASIEFEIWLPSGNLNIWDGVTSISCFLIGTAGMIFAFVANGGSNGKDFLGRYFSIGFVLFIKLMVLIIPISGVVYAIEMQVYGAYVEYTTAYSAVAIIVLFAAYCWRVYKHIGDVNRSQPTEPNPDPV